MLLRTEIQFEYETVTYSTVEEVYEQMLRLKNDLTRVYYCRSGNEFEHSVTHINLKR